MELVFKFLDKKEWSYYGTINVIIPTILILLINKKITSQDMIFVSLMGMMKGNIIEKILVTGFLNFLVFKPTKQWIIRSFIYVFSIILMHKVKPNNKIHKFVLESNITQYFMNIIILIWIIYILYDILFSLNSKLKIINLK